MRRTVALLAAVALAVAACGDDGDQDVGAGTGVDDPVVTTVPSDDPEDPDAGWAGPVRGGEVVATSIVEDGVERPLVEGTELRITFEVPPPEADALPSMAVDAGCNRLGFSYDVVGDILHVSGGSTTDMGCDPELMDQDAWITSMLDGEVGWARDGDTLTLTSGAVTITLVPRSAAAPDAELVGPTWTLDTIVEGDTARSVPAGVTAMVVFSGDGGLQVATGCNTGTGGYARPGGASTIEVTPPSLTRRGCPEDGAAEVEAAMVQVLDGAVEVDVAEQRLTLTTADGHGLGFTAG